MADAKETVQNKASDIVRLASIKEKEKRKELHKQQIRDALQGEAKNQNHVTFSDSDDEDSESKKKKFADNLLGLEDVDESDNVLEPRFKGKNTEKLLNLQSRYGNDNRFRLDDKFAEDSDSSSENETPVADDGINEEAKRNMLLVDQIIGHVTKPKKTKPAEMFSARSGQRYDPNTKNGMELEVTTKNIPVPIKKKKPVKPQPDAVESTPDLTKFFNVSTDVLKNTFTHDDTINTPGKQSHTFSFLDSLKQDPDLKNNIVESEKINSPQAIPMQTNASDYDSSSDDEQEARMIIDPPDTASKAVSVTPTTTFFPKSTSDPLIAAAAQNFCWNKTYSEMQKEWLEVKDILMKDYKKKHRDAMRKRADNSSGVHQNMTHGYAN